MNHAVHARLDELATDIGRLRRRHPPESSDGWLCERIANHVEALTLMLEPSAAQIAAWHAPRDPAAVNEAIRLVDAWMHRLHQQLGAKG